MPRSSERGQATVEWIGLLLAAALVLGALAAALGLRPPGASLAEAIAERLVCAARLSGACRAETDLDAAYGGELAQLVRAHAPRISYESGMRSLPVDFRDCRSPSCADGPESGRVVASAAGRPATAFTRVIDCREPGRAPPGLDCAGERAGRVYLQYWLYYPDSATLRGVPIAGRRGYHLDDWESYQVRIEPDGAAFARASSHRGYNGARGELNKLADAGWGAARDLVERLGLRERGGWARSTGTLFVSGGSHAGHVAERSLRRELARSLAGGAVALREAGGDTRPDRRAARRRAAALAARLERSLFGPARRHTPSGSIELVPIESLGFRDVPFAITPPWRKRVYLDPEYAGTD